MKRVVLILFILSVGVTDSLFAQDAAAIQPTGTVWSGAVNTGVYSKYLGTNNGAIFADEAVIQSEFDLNWKRGRTSGTFMVWDSKGFKRNWQGYEDEVDLGAVLNRSGTIDVSVNFWHFALVPIAGSDVQAVGFRAGKSYASDRGTVTPFGRFDRYWRVSSNGPKSGNFATAGLSYAEAVSKNALMNLQVQVIRDIDGAFGFKPDTTVYRFDSGVDLTVDVWTISPKLSFTGAIKDSARPASTAIALVFARSFAFSK